MNATQADIIKRVQAIRADLNKRFRMREDVIGAMLASMLAGELMLLLGLRGEAKTAIVEALAGYISDGKHFSVGLAKSSTPDDVLGGVDVVALQNGTYRRNTTGFLPEATTFLLDEGFKSNNPTLQALLRVLSEREFQGQKIPALFGALASNELPAELRGQKNGKAADLGPFEDSLLAFFDRFFHKLDVQPLAPGSSNWDDVVFGAASDAASAVRVTADEIRDLQRLVGSVALGVSLQDSVRSVAQKLATEKVHVSTRTWRKAVRMLRAHALLDGRMTVRKSDLRWLEHALWTTPDQRQTIREIVTSAGSREVAEALAIEVKAAEFMTAFADRRLAVSSSGDLYISPTPVSQLAAASANEPLAAWLKHQSGELQQLAAKDDDGENKRVQGFVDAKRGEVIDSIMRRLKQI